MTENKRFNVFDVDGTIFLEDHKEGSYHIGEIGNVDVNCLNDIADRLNELAEENEQLKQQKEVWKQICCANSNFNSILLHELDIAREQGFKVSNPFKQFLEDKGDV